MTTKLQKISMKISIKQWLQLIWSAIMCCAMREKRSTKCWLLLIWSAIMLKDCKIYLPYEYYANLIPNAGVCDNNTRISKCNNQAKVALANPVIELKGLKISHTHTNYYHVCQSCAIKYIGTEDGEDLNM